MKNLIKYSCVMLQVMPFLVSGASLATASYSSFSSAEDNDFRASFAVSIQYEQPELELLVEERDTDGAEYENQELDENVPPEDAEYIEQEEGEEYILVDEHGNIVDEQGNIVDEATLFEEQGELVEEGFVEQGEQYLELNEEEEGGAYLEEGEVVEEGEPVEGEVVEEELYHPDTAGQEVDEPR
jgi:hypothetical protein